MKTLTPAQLCYRQLLAATTRELLALAPKLEGIEQVNARRLAGQLRRVAKARPAPSNRAPLDSPPWLAERITLPPDGDSIHVGGHPHPSNDLLKPLPAGRNIAPKAQLQGTKREGVGV